MSLLDRLRAPGRRALSDAGPPDRWVLLTVAVGLLLVGVLWLFGWRDIPWQLWLVVPGALTLVLAVADRDGWVIREALVWLALRMRERWKWGPMPGSEAAADRWLADAANDDAPKLVRATVMAAAGRRDQARHILADLVPASPNEAVTILRARMYLDAAPGQPLALGPIRAAAADLEPDDRRYHLLSAVWMQAQRDLLARRPWRGPLAAMARELGPFPLPRVIRVWAAIPQLAAPLAFASMTLILLFVLRD